MESEATRGHRTLPHTADVIVEAWGSDGLACAEEAAQALIEICVRGEPDDGEGWLVSTIDVPAAELVQRVLEEIVFALDTSEAAPVSARLDPTVDSGVTLLLGLARPGSVQVTGAAPKAIVMQPEPRGTDGSVRCRFIVDV